ncbi:flagellar motor switch protein FliN [Saccharospirillum impatiens]|uniref:flagellar motor switch protein FliN n=1 Tax=Saccharospirillum impatiens TaxID=169438 RepID=UPI00041457C2|nr:flagellar motor switch protein FliN [Saccharospirillum impatiens]
MSDNDLPPEDETGTGEDNSGQDDQALADEWAAAMSESGDDEPDDDDSDAMTDPTRAPLEEFGAATSVASHGDSPNLDVILDIPVVISMEVGNTQIPIRNLLQLNQGSVIELDRLAGEPLDVLVNGTLIAHGEVVMVNEKFGIRLTDVVSQQERIQRLR